MRPFNTIYLEIETFYLRIEVRKVNLLRDLLIQDLGLETETLGADVSNQII